MNVANEREAFLQAMTGKQENREEEVGGHTWRAHVASHGPAILYSELANIMSRMKMMLWDQVGNPYESPIDLDRLEDLTVDLGNYTEFLYTWTMEQKAAEAEMMRKAVEDHR